MATRTQAKAAIDNATAIIKGDIDTLPADVGIVEGRIEFGPMRYYLKMNTLDKAIAEGWASAIMATRPTARIRREGQYVDDEKENVITIRANQSTYVITGF